MEDDQQHDDDKIEVDVGLSKRDNQTVPAFLLKTYEVILFSVACAARASEQRCALEK